LLYSISMKIKIPLIVTALVIMLLPTSIVNANETQININSPLCLPFNNGQENCAAVGPSEYLKSLDEIGIKLPIVDLPAKNLAEELGILPYFYVGLNQSRTISRYPSPEDAIADTNAFRNIEAGFNYATFTDYRIIDNKKIYMINPGIWVNGSDTTGRVAGSSFSGLTFSGTPTNQFGWMIFTSESKRTPGYKEADYIKRPLNRYDVIQIFDTVTIDGIRWHLIGPDAWIDGRYAALVYPTQTPPEEVKSNRWIEINLFEQTVSVYEDGHLAFATLVSSGLPGWWTRPGVFQITEKVSSTLMTGSLEADRSDYYYLQDVPFAMYFDEARAFHGAYWHNSFGYQRSHGCANLSPADSQWLFEWANEGDYVYVWDASGVTPEDPDLYGAGGA
jgi:hypothetical protein